MRTLTNAVVAAGPAGPGALSSVIQWADNLENDLEKEQREMSPAAKKQQHLVIISVCSGIGILGSVIAVVKLAQRRKINMENSYGSVEVLSDDEADSWRIDPYTRFNPEALKHAPQR
jgi:beta-lactamase regulating signal transducer with metallopeptidase domain